MARRCRVPAHPGLRFWTTSFTMPCSTNSARPLQLLLREHRQLVEELARRRALHFEAVREAAQTVSGLAHSCGLYHVVLSKPRAVNTPQAGRARRRRPRNESRKLKNASARSGQVSSPNSMNRRFPAQMIRSDRCQVHGPRRSEPSPGREYEIAIFRAGISRRFAGHRPADFGEIRITYVPDELCIELKSLKLYIFRLPPARPSSTRRPRTRSWMISWRRAGRGG